MEDYQPFGPEWEKEMKQFPKDELIKMLGSALKKPTLTIDELKIMCEAKGYEVTPKH
ncbi:MAG: hypothetical protein GY870_15695 [archaeon]|nr:hypothetical protein [archaeon]